ncbi:MAG TPA: phosphocholine cytidylyltransferase family protein [Capillimicrobium sp.]|nr:phosphocholine cytidylyltransferase family protein [Capillimicrobium sp.]
MIGLVLAAGWGSRLAPLTDALPKTLLEVDGDRTILDVALGNLKSVGMEDVVVVTGFRSDVLEDRKAALERRHGLKLEMLFNPKALEWNNCYSLWCARDYFGEGVLMANGDTVHPASVEETLLASRGDSDLVIAVDESLPVADEEMKVQVSDEGLLTRITKIMDPADAEGEYIGVTLIEPHAGQALADALQATFERDPNLYYEDGFQELADRGGRVKIAPIGDVDWVEVDDHDDLAKAREVACRC